MDPVRQGIYDQMVDTITGDLTCGMEDRGLEPWTNQAINQFIEQNKQSIMHAVNELYDACVRDGDLEELGPDGKGLPNDAYREELYDKLVVPGGNDNYEED